MHYLILLSAISASVFTIAKIVLCFAPPFLAIGLRMLVAGMLFLGYYLLVAKKRIEIPKQDWVLFLQTGVISIFIPYCLEFWALRFMPSFKASLLYNLSPFIAAVLAYFFFGERMTLKKCLGLLIGFLGFIPMLLTNSCQNQTIFGPFSMAEIYMIAAVCTFTYGWIPYKKLIMAGGYSPVLVNGFAMTIGGILSLVISIWSGEKVASITQIGPFIFWLMLLVSVGNIIVYSLYTTILRSYSTTYLACSDFFSPLFAAFYGWFFLSEAISWHFFASSGIVFVGFYIFYYEELRQGYIRD